MPSPAAGLPVVVVGGYLGAGKTTLVNHLLRRAEGRRIAVLVNDFGDVGIDADLIQGADGGVLSLAGGCLCCSFGDDLVGTLAALRRRAPVPDAVLIELSGVALPQAVLRTARLAQGVDTVGALVVVDAPDVERQLRDRYVGDTVRRQLAEADWVLVNKAATLAPAARTALADRLGPLADRARLVIAEADAVPAELLLDWQAMPAGPTDPVKDAAPFASRPIGPIGTPAATVFEQDSLALPADLDLERLGEALAQPSAGVLRAKALHRDAQGAGRLLQVVGRRWRLAPFPVGGAEGGRLVLIGLRGRLAAARLAVAAVAGSSRPS